MAHLGGGAAVASARLKHYRFRANSSLVPTTGCQPFNTHDEPTGEQPESLCCKMDPKRFDDREASVKPPEKLNNSKKKKERDPLSEPAPARQAKRRRLGEDIVLTFIDEWVYQAKAKESFIQQQLSGQPLNIVRDEKRSKQFLDAAFCGQLSQLTSIATKLPSFPTVIHLSLSSLVKELGEQHQDVAATFAWMTDRLGRNALHLACDRKKVKTCQYLVREVKLDPNITDSLGYTPLIYAYGSTEIVSLLIENGADPNSAVHTYAVNRAYRSPLSFLLSKGASVNALFGGLTPLHTAAAAGAKDNVKTLLENGANPNDPNYIISPLMMASLSLTPSLECVEMLLKAGATPNINASGETPLHAAASTGCASVIKSLLSAKADPNVTNDSGLTPLEVAAEIGNEEALRLLFPVTQRIPYIPVWMPSGVELYANSAEAVEKRVQKSREKATTSKLKGDETFKRKDYAHAEYWYTKALEASYEHCCTGGLELSVFEDLELSYLIGPDFTRTELYGYRALCNVHLNQLNKARNDARVFAKLHRPEGHYLEGVIHRMMKDFREAAASFHRGLSLDPGNKKAKRAWQECYEKIQRPGGMLSQVEYPTHLTINW